MYEENWKTLGQCDVSWDLHGILFQSAKRIIQDQLEQQQKYLTLLPSEPAYVSFILMKARWNYGVIEQLACYLRGFCHQFGAVPDGLELFRYRKLLL